MKGTFNWTVDFLSLVQTILDLCKQALIDLGLIKE